MEKNKTFDLVKSILENHPDTRDDDFALIYKVAEHYGLEDCSFGYALKCWKADKMPSFEGITRARRKVQELNPSLRATERVAEIRAEQETEYHDFYSACK
jgi:hypothetical protein